MGSACGPAGASPTPGLREPARDVSHVRKYRRAARPGCSNGARSLLALLQEAGGHHQCVVRVRERSGAAACSARALLM
jgi:hypothetical protein